MRLRGRQLLCCVSLSLTACLVAHSSPPPAPCGQGMFEYQRTELYFGLLRPNGKLIEPTSFEVFLESYVLPVLPAGFTLVDGEGRYVVGEQDVREPSRMMIVLHRGEPAVVAAIERIRAHYKELFAQQSVLRADARACASFD